MIKERAHFGNMRTAITKITKFLIVNYFKMVLGYDKERFADNYHRGNT